MDPRLQSIHLGESSRREDYRRARAALAQAVGNHTLNGDLIARPVAPSPDLLTITPEEKPVVPAGTVAVAWLLDRGRVLPLKIGLNSVGRLPDNDVVIDDPSVSRRHCAIIIHSDLSIVIHDTASKNGTAVNGIRIQQPTRLQNGDEIAFCDRRLTFSTSPGGVPQAVPVPVAAKPPDDCTLIT
jgi:FHA domain